MTFISPISPTASGLSSIGSGAEKGFFDLSDLGIHAPSNFFFDSKSKGSAAIYPNPVAGAPQPKPNVLILINNPADSVTRSGAKITAPHRTMVIVAHGSPDHGVQKAEGGLGNFYNPQQLARLIKAEAGDNWNRYDKVVLFSCRVALKDKGSYAQGLANLLGKPVYAATEFGFVSPTTGNISVTGSQTANGRRVPDFQDPGRYIRFAPGGDPNKNAALQAALSERSENQLGVGRAFDKEFSGANKSGQCINTTIAQCIK